MESSRSSLRRFVKKFVADPFAGDRACGIHDLAWLNSPHGYWQREWLIPRSLAEEKALNTTGRHLLVEYTGCDVGILDDVKRIEELMTEAARAARCKIIASVFQPFEPQGVTGVVVIEESHLSIHTWPEHGYAAVDFFTCGQSPPEKAYESLRKGLRAARSEVMLVDRGLREPDGSLRIRSHRFHGRRRRPVAVPEVQPAVGVQPAAAH